MAKPPTLMAPQNDRANSFPIAGPAGQLQWKARFGVYPRTSRKLPFSPIYARRVCKKGEANLVLISFLLHKAGPPWGWLVGKPAYIWLAAPLLLLLPLPEITPGIRKKGRNWAEGGISGPLAHFFPFLHTSPISLLFFFLNPGSGRKRQQLIHHRVIGEGIWYAS